MLSWLKKTLAITMTGMFLAMPFINTQNIVEAASGRDCDGNAIIYCGALSVKELKKKINANKQLENYYNTIGIYDDQFGNLVNGYVYKNGNVTVGGKVVARDVYSSGRHYMPGSSRDNRFSYPIYWRHPSVSFNSSPLSAFVYLNDDGSFAYAVIKSCGNPVTTDKNAHVKYKLEINKWNDKDGNGKGGRGEEVMNGWKFRIHGNGIDRTVTTGDSSKGRVNVYLPRGRYTVTEIQQKGWESTTGLKETVNLNKFTWLWFGNKKIPVIVNSVINVKKFNDLDADGTRDRNESMLSGFRFRVTGPNNYNNTIVTDSAGNAYTGDLPNGTYTITEIQQPGWTNTTPLVRSVRLSGRDTTVWYGNRQPRYNITINKFNDRDRDGVRDTGEPSLQGRVFRITGNGVDRVSSTNSAGVITFGNLLNGTYTITETLPTGWNASTPVTQRITVNGGNRIVLFGNYAVTPPPPRSDINVDKFEDIDGNGQKDGSESLLSGWEFRLTSSNGTNTLATTNSSGRATFTDLLDGTYTLTETTRAGWTPTTQNPLQVVVSGSDVDVIFGNMKDAVKPAVVVLPVTGAGEAAAAMSLFGLGGAGYHYLRSRRKLTQVLRETDTISG